MRILAGEYKGREIRTGAGPGYRPAMSKVRKSLFSMLESRGVDWPGTRVLDLFAGSGSLGLEALSRGAAHACFVETDKKAAALITANADRFGVQAPRIAVRREPVRQFLSGKGEPFDLIFIDPPYRGNWLAVSVTAVLRGGWLAHNGLLNAEVESSLKLDPDEAFPPLECVADKTYGQTRVVIWRL